MVHNIFIVPYVFSGFFPAFLNLIVILALFSSVLIIITKNPIISVLYLILLFSSVSCYLIFIGIKFIGISYLLVYVGAVSILFLFILMLINIRVSELITDNNNSIPLALITVLSFFMPVSSLLPSGYLGANDLVFNEMLNNRKLTFYISSNSWDNNIINIDDITSIGNIMYTSYCVWLILTSIILLLAMVGSIVITIKEKY